jgi:hypothetical protein
MNDALKVRMNPREVCVWLIDSWKPSFRIPRVHMTVQWQTNELIHLQQRNLCRLTDSLYGNMDRSLQGISPWHSGKYCECMWTVHRKNRSLISARSISSRNPSIGGNWHLGWIRRIPRNIGCSHEANIRSFNGFGVVTAVRRINPVLSPVYLQLYLYILFFLGFVSQLKYLALWQSSMWESDTLCFFDEHIV